MMLAIETSQRQGSVAMRCSAGEIHIEQLRTAKRHDDDLLPAIDRLMKRLERAPSDLASVGVSVGPGGFTGLRIAVSTAMMFAEALNVQVMPVPSALVAVHGTTVEGSNVLVALACKGDSFWATRLQRDAQQWRILGEPGLQTSADYRFDGIDAVLADEHFPEAAQQRCHVARVPVVQPQFSAAACLTVAEALFAERGSGDPLQLSPIYPRQPEAVSIWEQRRGRF